MLTKPGVGTSSACLSLIWIDNPAFASSDICITPRISDDVTVLVLCVSVTHPLFSSLQDGNGTIENEELQGFLKDLMALVQQVRA